MIVIDASIVVTALADDGPDGDLTRLRLRGERLAAPQVIDLEVISAWRQLSARGNLDARRAEMAIADLRLLRLDRVPHAQLLERCWELRTNLTAYDAAYVALAEMLDVGLLTADRRLANAPECRCPIEVLQ